MTRPDPPPPPWEGAPQRWRSFAASRRVRLGDVTPDGELRLDAVARYLQDVAADDVADSGLEGLAAWVVRRTELQVAARPAYGEAVDLITWCSGTGAAWAERRTTVTWRGAPAVEASSLWVALDPGTHRPVPLDERFFAVYGDEVRDRPVRARLRLPGVPPPGADGSPWPLRRSDFDVLGHVNNAVAWAAVEQDAVTAVAGSGVGRATVEYRAPITDGGELTVVGATDGDHRSTWLVGSGAAVAVAAAVELTRR